MRTAFTRFLTYVVAGREVENCLGPELVHQKVICEWGILLWLRIVGFFGIGFDQIMALN